MACLRRGGKNDGSSESLAFNASKRKSIIQIYTEWANHYLERGRYKRNIQDLQVDISDGVLLADVIEAVIGTKVPGVIRKPKNPSQMVENITACLTYIGNLGVSIEGVTSKDVKEGNLKVILSLFFSLSRYKQAQKNNSIVAPDGAVAAGIPVGNGTNNSSVMKPGVAAPSFGSELLSKLPSPFRQSMGRSIPSPNIKNDAGSSSNSSIPSNTSHPSMSLGSKRNGQNERNRMMAPSIGGQGYIGVGGKGPPSGNSSRSGSPHTTSSASPASFIPQPKSGVARERIGFDKNRSRPSSTSSSSSFSHLPVKAAHGSSTTKTSNSNRSINSTSAGNGSMLDKFKLFNPKEKTSERNKGVPSSGNKRTSSSSGFSSARSERSDSSASVCSEPKVTPPESKEIPSFPKPSVTSPTNAVTTNPGVVNGKNLVKKIGGISTIKTSTAKSKSPEGKDPVSTKIEQLKSASRISKEKKAEKLQKANEAQLTNLPISKNSTDASLQLPSKNLIKTNAIVHSVTSPESKQKKDDGTLHYTTIQPDNPVRQSKIVANLKDKSSSVVNSASSESKSSIPEQSKTSGSIYSISSAPPTPLPVMENTTLSQSNLSSSNSSIPKPTAAVKGTSKITKDDKNNSSENSNTPSQLPENVKMTPKEGTKLSREDIYVAVHIAGPDTQVLDTGQQHQQSEKMPMPNLPKPDRSRADNRVVSAQGNVSIAMVSPIMSSSHKKGTLQNEYSEKPSSKHLVSQDSDKSLSKNITAEFRTRQEPIYEKVASRQITNPISTDTPTICEEGDDVVLNIKPMQPLLRASPYGYMRNLGPLSSPRTTPSSRIHPSLRMNSEYGEANRISSSRQFLQSLDSGRMYGLAMKRALSGCNSLVDPDYSTDADAYDIASGYMSDGEILRPGVTCRGGDDIASGYLSEGGTPVYSRKQIIRPKENSGNTRSPRIINVLQDDRTRAHSQQHQKKQGFDDSSSVSSGVSDTFPELSTDDGLTGSSPSSENNVYGSLKRSSASASSLKVIPSSSISTDRGRKGVDDHATYITSGSKAKQAHVKKTDSSMQTESSAFHHVSSTAWKKYMLQQQFQQHQQQQESQSGKNSPSEKNKDKKSLKNDGKKSLSSDKDSSSHRSSKHKLMVVRSETDRDLCPSQPSKPSKGGSCESLALSAGGSGRKGSSSRSSAVATATNPASSTTASHPGFKRPSASGSQSPYGPCNGSNSKAGLANRGPGSSSSSSKKNSSEKISEAGRANSLSEDAPQFFSRNPMSPMSSASPKAGETRSGKASKVKVCANTQTNSSDLYSSVVHSDSEYSSLGRCKYPPKQYFMTTPGPGTGLKERVYGTRSVLNGSPTPLSDYVMLSARAPRLSAPLRDLDNYATLDHGSIIGGGVSHYASSSWMRHSPSCGTSVTSSARGATLTEADSMESLSSTSSSIHAQIQHARANSLTHARLMLHQRELAGSTSPRLSRSNSIRSTKSEKLPTSTYVLQRSSSDADPSVDAGGNSIYAHLQQENNGSQPTSPSSAPQPGGRYMFPLSPGTPSVPSSGIHGSSRSSMSPYMTGLLSKMNSKDDDLHGSALSLVSTSSSIYSTAEDKQAHEIRKLKRELDQAHEKVATLTSQLTTNAHMVAAFEQSLSNMTNRLQHLTASAEQKDSELMELRKTIEALKKQSAEAGLTKMALQSMQAVQRTLQEHRISRQFSTDSMSSVNSYSSACSGNSGQSGDPLNKKKKKKGWLRSSFSKAFSRSKKNKNGSVSDVEDLRQLQSDSSTPNSPLLGGNGHNGNPSQTLKQSHSSSALYDKDEDESAPEVVKELKKQLREKDMILTDIRLDALSSAHQLENLKETVNKMRSEMASLKHDNDRLQRLMSTKSLTSSQSSIPLRNSLESLEKRLSASEKSAPSLAEMYVSENRNDHDGKLVTVSVYLGSHGDMSLFQNQNMPPAEVLIGNISISSKTQWDLLDNLVKRTFKEYVLRVDPVSNLGLNAESVVTYHIGGVVRSKEADIPELLPFGYVVGDNMHIKIVLKGTKQHSVDALAFESLIPKSIIQRYISLLTEHRRIILCGPSGTGKTYIAQKLAEYLVLKNGKELTAGAIATFSVDHKSAKELRQYLSNVAEQCETSNASDLPTVIILDNLHHVGSLGEVFNGFLSAKYQKCPYIIGTMNQATCSTTNLQLHHNFRWVLCANHMEPVKGFLGRYLKRKLIEEEVRNGAPSPDVAKVIDWMPKIWQHLNKYLETHSSSDVTIGPRLFLSCPVDVSCSQVWFTDLWNYSLVPYLLEAVREGLQLYGRRAPWEDPAEWVYETYPWPSQSSGEWPQLLRLRPEDVGYEGHPGPGMGSKAHANGADTETDPLLNMLMRLQEAASYSSPHSNDSDSTSMDSHGSGLHSDELINSGLESTL